MNCGQGTPNSMASHRPRGRSSPSTPSYAHVGADVSGKDNNIEAGSTSLDSGKLNNLNTSKHPGAQPFANVPNSHHNLNLPKTVHVATSHEEGKIITSIGRSEKPFDICQEKKGTPVKLKPSLLVKNKERKIEIKRSMGGQAARILRPGMVLLKNFISCGDQAKIVQTCRKLGLGDGGFYRPGYRDGALMHLEMMCLGRNWDPETNSYGERRPVDGAEPPPILTEFHQLVQKATQDAHAYLLKEVEEKHVESVLPSMTPDICIVNFYTSNGRLGLHQDIDESKESLNRGLPVVSISIGDSAEFLYGDQRNVDTAEKVTLQSGDVLIFGGKSRLVYHGVTSILSKTAPQALLQESDLRPGRLNLTFRKY